MLAKAHLTIIKMLLPCFTGDGTSLAHGPGPWQVCPRAQISSRCARLAPCSIIIRAKGCSRWLGARSNIETEIEPLLVILHVTTCKTLLPLPTTFRCLRLQTQSTTVCRQDTSTRGCGTS